MKQSKTLKLRARSQCSLKLTLYCFVIKKGLERNSHRDVVPEGFQQLAQSEQHIVASFGCISKTRRLRSAHHRPHRVAHLRHHHHHRLRPARDQISFKELTPNGEFQIRLRHTQELYKIFHFVMENFSGTSERRWKVIINSG